MAGSERTTIRTEHIDIHADCVYISHKTPIKSVNNYKVYINYTTWLSRTFKNLFNVIQIPRLFKVLETNSYLLRKRFQGPSRTGANPE